MYEFSAYTNDDGVLLLSLAAPLTDWMVVCLFVVSSSSFSFRILNYFECYLPQNVCLNKPEILRLQIGIIIN